MTTANDFPALTGSPKQIAWAETLRPEIWAAIERFAADFRSHVDRAEGRFHGAPTDRAAATIAARREGIALALELARTTTDASRWIDARGLGGGPALWRLTMYGAAATARWQNDPAKKHAMLAVSDFLQ